MSRFDLLFIVTDDVDETRDRQIADHVLRMHRYLPPGVEEGTPVADSLTQQLAVENTAAAQSNGPAEDADASPFEKYDPLLHVGIAAELSRTRKGRQQKPEILSVAFVKKYIQYAKSKPAPKLTRGAANHIVNVYATLRNEDLDGTRKKRVSGRRAHRAPAALVAGGRRSHRHGNGMAES